MHYGIEMRLPYLSKKVFEYALSLPPSKNLNRGWSKYILRLAGHGIIPKEIQWRKDKKGFTNPETKLINKGPLAWLKRKLKEKKCLTQKYNLLKSFDSCFLFTGNHNNINERESIQYNLNVKSEIEKLNLNCEIISGSVDDDFSLLSTSECYIAGYRGFSWLSACINPNLVIWDIQDPPNFPWVYPRSQINQAIQGYDFYLENHIAN